MMMSEINLNSALGESDITKNPFLSKSFDRYIEQFVKSTKLEFPKGLTR